MKKLSPLSRISIGLVMLTISIILTGDILFGVMSEGPDTQLKMRRTLTETLAIQFSALATNNDFETIQFTLNNVVKRNQNILSAALRTTDGLLRAESGVHSRYWKDIPDDKSTPTHAQVPIFMGDSRWGTVEVRYKDLPGIGLANIWSNSFVQLILYVGIAGFIGYLFFMRRTLKHLDPSSVVPGRVKTALDALAEGVVLTDEKSQIVLVNTAFCDHINMQRDQLLGVKLGDMGWQKPAGVHELESPPWKLAMKHGKRHIGTRMCLEVRDKGMCTFMVNGSPIVDDDGDTKGVLATFDDVTELEEKNTQLHELVGDLKISRDQVNFQNAKLQILAARDPLTNCLNRRSFNERCNEEFELAATDKSSLSTIMLDIDHFKKVNDNYGHGVGDQVIQTVADQLRAGLRSIDVIGRYGGEEFCVLLPGLDSDGAERVAERLRKLIEENASKGAVTLAHKVTSSFGVASYDGEIADAAQLIDQADKSLYYAKNNGRNQVSRWDQLSDSQVA